MNQSHERQIEYILKKLWLNESEITIFMHWLRIGPSTIINLAKHTQTKRITTHAIVHRLIEKWLFLEAYNKKRRLVYPNTLDSLQKLLDKKKFELQELEQEVQSTSEILKSIQSQSENFPKVRFYKGKEGIQIMLNEVMKDKKNMYVISDSQHFYDLIDNNFLEESHKIRQKNKIEVQMVFPIGFEHFYYTQWTYKQKPTIKVLPNEKLMKWWINIWWNKVALHCYKNWFITTTIIENPEISNIILFMFKNVWNIAQEY